MRLSDLAFWRSDKDKFADLVRRALIAAGERRPMQFDKSNFALRFGVSGNDDQTQVLYLQNFYSIYARLPKAKQAQELEHIVA
jgi:hypothetical protein